VYTLAAECAHANRYAQFVHTAWGDEGEGVQLIYEGTCYLARGVVFDRNRDKGVVCVSSTFKVGGGACGCMCVYTHTHTHAAHGVLRCEPRSWDETPEGPEESIWTKSRHTFVRICVQSTHVYV